MPYWVKLKNDSPFCLVVDHEKIKALMTGFKRWNEEKKMWFFDQQGYNAALDKYLNMAASQYGEVESIATLPYAASPMKPDVKGHPVDDWALCFDPNNCCGKTSCPRSRACSE